MQVRPSKPWWLMAVQISCLDSLLKRRSPTHSWQCSTVAFVKDGKSRSSWYLQPLSVSSNRLCHVCSLVICFRNVHDGNDEAYLVQVGLFVASRPSYWLYAVIMLQIREEFDLVSLDLSVQFKRSSKHLPHVKAQGTLIYSSQIRPHKPHDDGVSGAALSLCSSLAQQPTASPSRFC